MNRSKIAAGIVTAAERIADRIDPPEYGVKIVWDDDYDPHSATAWGEPEDSEYEAKTRAKLESGEWIVVGVVAIEKDRAGIVREAGKLGASLWGIVTDESDMPDWAYGYDVTPVEVWDLAELSGDLLAVADDLISEAQS